MDSRFPRLYAAASLKRDVAVDGPQMRPRFPRLYAAASLKQCRRVHVGARRAEFSAALCRGLIEATSGGGYKLVYRPVFRGFMPRPH